MNAVLKVALLALGSSLFFAIQHPLSRPLAKQNFTWDGIASVALLSSITALMGSVLLLFVHRGLLTEYVTAMRNLRSYPNFHWIIFCSASVAILYNFGLSVFPYATASIMLNTLPFWGVAVQWWFERKRPPTIYLAAAGACLISMGVSVWLDTPSDRNFFWLLISAFPFALIPLIFLVGYILRRESMQNQKDNLAGYTPLSSPAAVLVTGTFSSSVIAALCLVATYFFSGSLLPNLRFDTFDVIVFYVLGTLSFSLIGTILYQSALKTGQEAFVTLFSAAIPGMSAAVGIIFFWVFGRPEFEFNKNLLWTMVVAAIAVSVVTVHQWRSQMRSS